jgi:DNA binding domain, excisionase family
VLDILTLYGNSMTIQDACQRLGKSESTIRRWIAKGKLTATKIEGVWDVPESAVDALSNDKHPVGNDQQVEAVMVEQLREENRYLKERIEELEGARERTDTIILQLTRQLEQSQRLLEYHQAPWWRRWFSRKKPG